MKYFFVSDFHFGHANILKYCGRTQFMTKEDLDKYSYYITASKEEQKKFIVSKESLENMNEALIKNHNERVKPEDWVFCIGDFVFRNSPGGKAGEGTVNKPKDYLSRLNGKFVFIQGNHDRCNSLKTPIISCHIRFGNKIINLVHNPEYADMDCSINLCGHVHQNYQFKRIVKGAKITDVINVGVDVNRFYPVTYEELMAKYYRWLNKEGYNK